MLGLDSSFNLSENYLNTVCPSTSVSRALSALDTRLYLSLYSSSLVSVGSPSGCGIATAGTILFAPTVSDIGTTVHTWTTGIPALSISFTIVAPQRVQVPHVEVRITALTQSSIRFLTMPSANPLAFATEVPFPTVAYQ